MDGPLLALGCRAVLGLCGAAMHVAETINSTSSFRQEDDIAVQWCNACQGRRNQGGREGICTPPSFLPNYTVIPYRVEQGACRELPILKTVSLQYEQDLCKQWEQIFSWDYSRFSLWECGHREYLLSLQGPGRSKPSSIKCFFCLWSPSRFSDLPPAPPTIAFSHATEIYFYRSHSDIASFRHSKWKKYGFFYKLNSSVLSFHIKDFD